MNTGIRCGEQYGLTWEYVNSDNRVLTVALSKHGEMRHVPMNATAVAAFEQLRKKKSKGQNAVFANQGPRHWFEDAIRRRD